MRLLLLTLLTFVNLNFLPGNVYANGAHLHQTQMPQEPATSAYTSLIPWTALIVLGVILVIFLIIAILRKHYLRIPFTFIIILILTLGLTIWGAFFRQFPKVSEKSEEIVNTYAPYKSAEGPLHLAGFSYGLDPDKLPQVSDIVRDPTDVLQPIKRDEEEVVKITINVQEVVSEVAPGIKYYYWTFNGSVPGPFIRVREGDTIELTFINSAASLHTHSIDFHAVTGPGGGATITQTKPGEVKKARFKALNPGLFVYHCATPDVPSHMANGMYGLILVEPKEGLPKVDREFYVMQGELFTKEELGQEGFLHFDPIKMTKESPTYILFNGKVQGLSGDKKMQALVGEKIRIFFGNGSVALSSAFHVIGEIFDKAWPEGGWGKNPLTNTQSILVGAGSSAIVEFKVEVPGNYTLVDHALARLNRGGWGVLTILGAENPDIYQSLSPKLEEMEDSGH